ncbi:hypothetical protein CLV78_101167 [Aliiruegeria haliotis]|uniref:Uncharacterized protein n=1 Tax=Aliiruegeria haliotis TaxID=1280846 RepID=A0A2T0RY11_9RHOB|nr:hypothetical protein [Aliiruegeria haliotis]PRY26074.1 hypothetical protein CLV78_101167 [Aliiruegeria haliotis]
MRLGAALVLGSGLVACQQPVEITNDIPVTQEVVVLPASTQRINARVERERQLVTGTYRDDIAELTGAPSAHGKHPAYAPLAGKTAYRYRKDAITAAD